MKRTLFRTQLLAICVLLPAIQLSAQTGTQTAKLRTFQTGPMGTVGARDTIPGAHAKLVRRTNGIEIDVRTRDLPAGAYTTWWIIFNHPDMCTGPCDPSDFGNSDVAASVLWAAGGIVDASGRASFQAELLVGVSPGYVRFGNGLLDAYGAEVHYVFKTHGPPAMDDSDLLLRQVSSFDGACSDEFGHAPDASDPIFPCWDPQSTAFPASK